jgi:hypothetical protein
MTTNTESTFYKAFFALPRAVRRKITTDAGLSLEYVLKQMYVREGAPTFRFHNALALDKASAGTIDVWQHGEGVEGMDLHYLAATIKRELGKRKQGVLTSTPQKV